MGWARPRSLPRGWATCVMSSNLRRGLGSVEGRRGLRRRKSVQLARLHRTPAELGPGIRGGRVPKDSSRRHRVPGGEYRGTEPRGAAKSRGRHGAILRSLDVRVGLTNCLHSRLQSPLSCAPTPKLWTSGSPATSPGNDSSHPEPAEREETSRRRPWWIEPFLLAEPARFRAEGASGAGRSLHPQGRCGAHGASAGAQ